MYSMSQTFVRSPLVMQGADPAATTNTNLYTVPTNAQLRIHTLSACNRSGSAVTIRIGFDIAGAGTDTPAANEWLYYDLSVPANDTIMLDASLGMVISESTDIVVFASAQQIAFLLTGELEYR